MKPIKLIALFLSSLNIFSCKPQPYTYEPAPNGKSLLWQVTGNQLTKPTYIFGTMHLMCGDDAQLSPTLKSVIKNADEIYFEIDLDEAGELLAGLQHSFMRNDTSLKNLYNPNDYTRVETFFQQHALSREFEAMQRMQPMLVSAALYPLMMPCLNENGMEMSILKEAKPQHKEIKGLETAAYQASIIDSIPYEAQAKELLNMIDSLDTYKKQLQEMMRIYKLEDVEALYKYALQGDMADQEVQEKMLNRRNRNWAEKFSAITTNKTLLIAVGAAHLGGENGLLNLLRKQGYTLTPISNKQ